LFGRKKRFEKRKRYAMTILPLPYLKSPPHPRVSQTPVTSLYSLPGGGGLQIGSAPAEGSTAGVCRGVRRGSPPRGRATRSAGQPALRGAAGEAGAGALAGDSVCGWGCTSPRGRSAHVARAASRLAGAVQHGDAARLAARGLGVHGIFCST